MSRAFSACGFSCPWNLDTIASAGFPGISLGSRKLTVSAIHSVSRKKPRRRNANLMLASSRSCRAPVGLHTPAGGACPGACAPGHVPRLLRLEVQQHLLHVRVGVGGRLGV